METTIKKTVKGSTMEAIFDNCQTFSIRHFNADNITADKYNPKQNYSYTIRIRHAEDTDANVLFEEARFKFEILEKRSTGAAKKIARLQLKVDKLTAKLENDIRAICEQLDYKNSSRFSYNIDRLQQFNKELQSFEIFNDNANI
jgi:hypothetical protein